MSRSKRIGIAFVAVAALATGFLLTRGSDEAPAATSATKVAATQTTDTVSRRTLQQTEEFKGSLGYGDQFALPGNTQGTVSWVPEKGTLLQPGDQLYKVDEKPTFWTRGEVPMYRELSSGSEGADVEQLQRYLQEGEYLSTDIEIDGKFGGATRTAVKAWQDDHDLKKTGKIDATQLLFLPYEAIRVASTPRVGEAAMGGVIEVTEPDLFVTVDVSARKKRAFEGQPVIEVETADGSRFDATVESITAQQSQDAFGGQNYRVRLQLEGGADMEPGEAAIEAIDVLAEDVLTVPARALVALVEGGYAVELVQPNGATAYRAVEIGEFADGWVEVIGDIAEGDQVAVPE